MRKHGRRIILWALPLFAAVWVFSQVDFGEMSQVLGSLRFDQIGLLISLNVFIFILFALRWWIFVRASGAHVPFKALIRYRLTSFGITYFTPGPQFGGEPYQVYALTKKRGISTEVAASSVSMDKLTELAANFSFLVIGLGITIMGGHLPAIIDFAILPIALFLLSIPLTYLFLIRMGRKPMYRIFSKIASFSVARNSSQTESRNQSSAWVIWSRWVSSASKISKKSLPALQATEGNLINMLQKRPLVFFLGLGLAALTWLLLIGEYHLALDFLGLPLTLAQTIVVLTAARIAFMLPAPSGFGTLEASQVIALQAFGFGPAEGVGISLLIRSRDVLFGATGLLLAGRILK